MRNVSELDGNAYITNSSFPAPGEPGRLLRVMFETPDEMVIDVQAYRKGRYDGFPPFACLYVNVATGGIDLSQYTYTPVEFAAQTDLDEAEPSEVKGHTFLPIRDILGNLYDCGGGRTLLLDAEDEGVSVTVSENGGRVSMFVFSPNDGRIITVVTGREMFEYKVDQHPHATNDEEMGIRKDQGVI